MECVQFIAALVCGGAALAMHDGRHLSAVLGLEQEEAEATEGGLAFFRLCFLHFKKSGTCGHGKYLGQRGSAANQSGDKSHALYTQVPLTISQKSNAHL